MFAALLILAACQPPGGGGTTKPTPAKPAGEKTVTPKIYTTTVSGKVTDTAGTALDQAQVSINTTPSSPANKAVKTQSDGTFRLKVTHRGKFSLTVEKAAYKPFTTPLIDTKGPAHSLAVIKLTALKTYTTTVSGKITDASGSGLDQVQVSVNTNPGSPANTPKNTHSDGTFSLQVTHPGTFTLSVQKTGFKTYTTPGITSRDSSLTLTPIQLPPGGAAQNGSGGVPNPGAEPEGRARFSLDQNPGTSPTYTLSITEGVKTIAPGEFAATNIKVTDPADPTRQIDAERRLAGLLGTTSQELKVTALKLPESLVTIGESGFYNHYKLGGELIIPAAVESINDLAFYTLSGAGGVTPSAVNLKFAPNSKLKEIGAGAFREKSIVGLTRLPENIETIGDLAFYDAFSENIASFTIPGNVRSIGTSAFARGQFASRFTGTLTIESPHLTRTPPLSPSGTSAAKTGSLGDKLLQAPAGGASPVNQLTVIYLHSAVFNSYSQAEREAVFGTFAKPQGKYVDIADRTTELR